MIRLSKCLTEEAVKEPLEKKLGQTIIVENRVGAGGNIAGEYVAKADGYTFSVMINGNMTIAKLLNPAVRYDPVKDLQPVSLIGVAPLVLVAPAGTPQPIIDKLSAEVDRILKKPEVVERFAKLGADVIGYGPEKFSAFINADLKKWADIAQRANIKIVQ